MVVVAIAGRWEARASYDDRHVLKDCGFRWDPTGRVWWTDSQGALDELDQRVGVEVLEDTVPELALVPASWDGHPSCATDGPDDIPCPPGLAYLPYQRGGIGFARGKEGVLIADEPGLGKTIQAIGIMNDEPVKTALVVVPASLKTNWQREIDKWLDYYLPVDVIEGGKSRWPARVGVVIINYDLLKKFAERVHGMVWDILIADEAHYCLRGDTRVSTDVGVLCLSDVVDGRLGSTVLSWNERTGEAEQRLIEDRFSSEDDRKIVKIHHETGTIVCTDDHRVWLEGRGWIKASEVVGGDLLRVVSEEVFEAEEGESDGAILQPPLLGKMEDGAARRDFKQDWSKEAAGGNRVLELRDAVPSHEGEQGEEILRSELCGYSSQQKRGCAGGSGRPPQEREEDAERAASEGVIPPYDLGESDAKSRGGGENAKEEGRANISVARRERENHETAGMPSSVAGGRVGDGICDFNEGVGGGVPIAAESLQGRPCLSAFEAGGGGGWEDPQVEAMEIPGSEKNRNAGVSRVERCEVLERGSGRERRVYCLQVEGNGNFFADRVLVHNCKNPEAKRTKMLMAIRAKKRVFLSGTPAESRPSELYTVAHALRPDLFPSWLAYAYRYCDARHTQYGLEARGASNVAELQALLRNSMMVRRKKTDVLKDLPAKIRRKVILPCLPEMKKLVDAEMATWRREKEQIDSLRKRNAPIEEVRLAQNAANARMNDLRIATTKAKMPMCLEFLKNAAEEGKLIVFAKHHIVMDELLKAFPTAALIHGGIPSGERQGIADRFQKDPDCGVFIGQIQAAGVGLTLTAASHVVFVEFDWRPGLMHQCEDRAHRIGQADSVLCSYLMIENSLDEVMMDSSESKVETLAKTLDV